MLSWIGIEKGGVALKKKNLRMTLLDIQGPIKYMYQSPSQKKTTLFPGILVLSLSLRLF